MSRPTADDSLVRVQHAATDRVEYAERVRIALSNDPVAVRPRD